MHFNVDGRPEEVAAFVNRAVAIPGLKAWTKREEDFARQIQSNPLIERYLETQFGIEYSMFAVRRHVKNTGRIPSIINSPRNDLGQLYSFAGIAARVFPLLSAAGKNALRTKMLGALKDNIGLAPLAFEMRTVAHLMACGFEVEFVDLCGEERFDFLIRRSNIEMEVECKSVSGDLGHQIHLLRQYQLGPYLWPSMKIGSKDGVVQLLVATLPDRLHGQREYLATVAERITKALTGRIDVNDSEPCSVSYREFPITGSPFDRALRSTITEEDALQYCHGVMRDELGHVMMMFQPQRNATIVALRSTKPDHFLRGLYRNIKEAASEQLSGTRPGVICVQLRNLTTASLRDLAENPGLTRTPTALQLMTAKFFDSDARAHVHTLSYIAPGNYVQRQLDIPVTNSTDITRRTIVTEDASSYNFRNRKNPYENDRRYFCF